MTVSSPLDCAGGLVQVAPSLIYPNAIPVTRAELEAAWMPGRPCLDH
ncbi:MAG: hypothetical protein ACUVV6_04115 [Thermoplasmatota archaeon]